MQADAARDRFKKIRVRFAQPPAKFDLPGVLNVKQSGREVEILANGTSDELIAKLKTYQPEGLQTESLTLEEIFVASNHIAKTKS